MSEQEQVIRRLDDLGDTIVAGTSAPPFDAHALRRRRPQPHRGGFLAAAAAAALVVVAVVVWSPWSSDPKRVDTVATTVPADDSFPMLMPAPWLEAGPGDITTRDPYDPGSDPLVVAEHLLARDGVAAAYAVVGEYAFDDTTPDVGNTSEPAAIDGHDARWVTGPNATMLLMALEPGRSLTVISAAASRDELEALALAYDGEHLDFDHDAMPDQWSTQADAADVIQLLGGIPPSSWASVSSQPSTGELQFVVATRVEDPASVLDQIVGLGAARAERVQIAGRPGVIYSGVGPHPGAAMVVWEYDESTVAAAVAGGAEPSAAIAVAESVRAVDASTWSSFTMKSTPSPSGPTVDGFQLLSDEDVVVESGEAFGHRWMITTGPLSFRDVPEATTGTYVYLIGPDGAQSSFGWSGGGGAGGAASGIIGRFRYFQSEVPRDVSDPAIVLHGQRREVVEVDTGGDTVAIFTIVESRSTPKVNDGDLYVIGTLPDGSEYRNPPPPFGS